MITETQKTGQISSEARAHDHDPKTEAIELESAETTDILATPYMVHLKKRHPSYFSAACHWRPKILAYLAKRPFIGRACEDCRVSAPTVMIHRQKDPIFDSAVTFAMTGTNEVLEESAWIDGVEGYQEPVFQGGKQVGSVLRKSDAMRGKLMEGRIPERYSRKVDVSVSGALGVAVMAGADLERLIAQIPPGALPAGPPLALPEEPAK